MPAALPIDWERAKLLRFQGLTYREIGETVGATTACIQARAGRENWNKQQTQARNDLTQGVIRTVQASLAERAHAWSERIIKDVEASAETATNLHKPRSRKALREHEELMSLHVKRGRTMFGLDADTGSIHITIGVPRGMSAKRIDAGQDDTSDTDVTPPEQPPIDV